MGKSVSLPSGTAFDLAFPDIDPQRNCGPETYQRVLNWYNQRGKTREEGLAGVFMYCWRQFPKIDQKLTGRPYGYIAKIDCVNDDGAVILLPDDVRGWVRDQFGGGRFRVSLNDKQQGERTQVATLSLKVDDVEYAPILDPRELCVTDPETSGWITRALNTGLLARKNDGSLCLPNEKDTAPPKQSGNGDAGMARIAEKLLDERHEGASAHAMKRQIDMIADTASDMLKRQTAASDPNSRIQDLLVVAEKLNGGNTGMMPLVIAMIQENGRLQTQMFQAMADMTRTQARPREESQVATLDKLLSFAERLNPKSGGILEGIKEMIPSLLPLAMALMAGRGAGGPGVAAALAGIATPAAASPAAAVGPLDQRKIDELAGRILQCMARNQDGGDFANAIDTFFSPELYDQIRALGRDGIARAMTTSAHAAKFAEIQPQLAKFVDEFLAYGDEAPPSGTPPGTPPPPPAAQANGAPAGAV